MPTAKNDRLLQQFNATIDTWIAGLDDYSLKQLTARPGAASWSLGQVYVHIIKNTHHFVAQMRACLSSDKNKQEEMHGDAKVMFANNDFPDKKLDGPDTGADIRQPQSKEELLQGLTQIKKEVNALYAGFDFAQPTGKTRHPGLLYFNAQEWLQFAEMHMRHHFRQKKRIDDEIKKA